MEGPYFKRKKRGKKKIENLYKILGTRSNIGQERIKEKYIKKVREFPPETHPEEFQEIRRAYEILKDPKKRKQYDMMRKYGNKIEKAMEEAMALVANGNYEKAKRLLEDIQEIDPDDVTVKFAQAEVSLELEEFEQFYSLIDEILEVCDIEEKEFVIFIEFNMLSLKGYSDKALDALEHGKEYIVNMEEYHRLRIMAFIESENSQQAWGEFKDALSSTEDQTIDDLDILIAWLNTAIELEKWGEISKIQTHIRKLSKTIIEEELSILKSRLIEEVESYTYAACYREADIFMQILNQIDQKDIYIKEHRKQIQGVAKLDIELSRVMKDQEMFPYVSVKMIELYLAKYSSPEYYEKYLEDYPYDMMNEMECMKEEIAYGIIRTKKKYPSLYKEFNEELVDLFNQSTEGLNREQRRRLR